MDWYLMVWKKYADFNGRSRRKEYWMFALFNFLALLALVAVGGAGLAFIDNGSGIGGVLFVPLGVYILAALIPSLAVRVRRLHDSGKSGWFLLLALAGIIPIVGIVATVLLIVFMCLDSDPGSNEYGPNPKFPELSAMAAGNPGFPSMGLGAFPPPFIANTGEYQFGFCKSCGAKFEDASPFCSRCGTPV